jgi:hypothetical protein
MKRTITILLALSLPLLLAACAAAPTETEPPAPPPAEVYAPIEDEPPAPEPEPEPFPGKIAIITNDIIGDEEEFRSAQRMVAKYGEDKIIHKIWPVNFPMAGEQMIIIVRQIAADPDIKALVINQCVQNSMAAVDKLLEIRSDMFLAAIQPTENPTEIAERFNLILNAEEIMMGNTIPAQAQKLGATTFVHLSFPRHMTYALLYARHEIMKENCEKLGLKFVDYTVPDPTGDIGMAGAQQVMLEEIPKLVAEYGQDTAFFCTNCGLQIPLIKAVVDSGAIYPQPCCPSPFHGFPVALGLMYEGDSIFYEADDQYATRWAIEQITEKLREKGGLGRVSTWPLPISMLNTMAATEYAIKWINGEVPMEGIDVAAFEQCMSDYVGVECFARSLGTHEADSDIAEGEYPHWLFVMEDYLTFE